MQVVNIPTMKGMIAHLAVRKHRPLFFWGPSGVGKSEAVQQSCEEHGGTLVDIRLSQYESVDMRGIPDVQERTTVWNAPATLPFKGNAKFELGGTDKPIYLFLDEINSAEPSTAAVCYQLINDRRIGEHELMDNVVMIAAGNREQDKGVTNRFPAPLANRGTHAELVPDVDAWIAWAATAKTATGRPVPAGLLGFLKFRDGLLHTFDPNKPTKVFATPRTWMFAADDMSDPALSDDIRIAAMSGSVGEGPAVELQGFMEIMTSLVPIDQIIANPLGVPVDDRLDLQWAMASHIAGNLDKTNADPLQQYLERLPPEMVVLAWTLAINRDEDITDTNAFLYGYAPKYRAVFQA